MARDTHGTRQRMAATVQTLPAACGVFPPRCVHGGSPIKVCSKGGMVGGWILWVVGSQRGLQGSVRPGARAAVDTPTS